MRRSTSLLIVPECSAPGCHHSGDQSTMVKCRACGCWFCEAHLVTAARATRATTTTTGEPGARVTQVPTIKLMDTGARGLTYYLGYCAGCLEARIARTAADSTWLR
jgi:hypothetical protein